MSDPRFARLKTDPRFRRPKKKQQKVIIDERFKSVLNPTKAKGKDRAKLQVDKYGRKLSQTHDEDNLKKYYRLTSASDDENENKAEGAGGVAKPIDYARGEVLMESSDEEIRNRGKDAEESDQSDTDEIVRIGGSDKELEIDLDEDTYAELDAQVTAYAKSSKDLQGKEEERDASIANRTRRLAVVNLDWDYVRASHLYKIFSSLVSLTIPYIPVTTTPAVEKDGGTKKDKSEASSIARGAVLSVRVYPSEFGKARIEREKREGPPAEIFKKKRKESEEINEKTIYEFGGENDYDHDALRRYQLERLRFYYAIVECDTTEAASHIYDQLEGTELERSANVFDLSFVPEDMTFDNDPRDEATEDASTEYKPIDYVTDALRHSKVKLTWDEDDPERHQMTRRTLTRQEIEDSDFRAYIASSSEGENGSGDEGKVKTSNKDKDASRQKLRALLVGGNDDALPEGWNNEGDGRDVDMEITFTPGLSREKDEGTTLDKYQQKAREKRKKRKEEHKKRPKSTIERKDSNRKVEGDDFFSSASDREGESDAEAHRGVGESMSKKNGLEQTPPPWKKATTGELTLIASSNNADGESKHFDMKAVLRAERRKGRKGKKEKKDIREHELQEDFTIDVNDDRFKALHEDHQFAIDPTNPQFKNTTGMKAFLQERHRRQKGARSREQHEVRPQTNSRGDHGWESLVESVKRKSHEAHKRRRV